jgi:arginine:ornithine antiporter/lysine permease
LVTILSYGILLRSNLAALRTPSMAAVLAAIVDPWGAALISIGLLVSVLGNFSAARTYTIRPALRAGCETIRG